MKAHIIIVAGGKGERMHTDIPKQFIEINGTPMLMHTLKIFKNTLANTPITLVLPKEYNDLWDNLCRNFKFNISHQVISGGETRFQSVKNGLSCVQKDCIVAIHDGVRPLVSSHTILRCLEAAENYGAAVPVMPIKDSLRKIDGPKSKPLVRSNYRIVQTPQCFRYEIIAKAYESDYNETLTDDASIAEAAGYNIHCIEGNDENIKITTPADIVIAKALLGVRG
ncbi:MAG: 2-C-methyl-D-erythritol 4-phosphate cytidylyltransferase [Bacteroidales bacterium]|nr:2-C-methyl-D-erythritol 4-phosphate cytidylyltransferase [Bacteroidales bacterium]